MLGRHLSVTGVFVLGLAALLTAPAPVPAKSRGYYYSNGYWWAYDTYRHGYNPGYYAHPYPVAPHGVSPGHYGNYAYPLPPASSGKGVVKSGAVYTYPWPGSAVGSHPATASAAAPTPTGPAPVEIDVRVPPDAEIWFDGAKTTLTGPFRRFVSPPLALGHEYAYTVKVRWNENGNEVTQSRRVTVRPGEQVSIAFPTAATAKAR